MERTPKQRIIFDEDMYDDEFLRDYLAEDYEIYKDELDVSFDEYVEHRRNEGALYDIKERDFTDVSKPGSGLREVIAIQNGKERDPERVSLKSEAEQARAASDKLADERGAGSLAREDPTIV